MTAIIITATVPDIVLSRHTTDEFLTALREHTTVPVLAYDDYSITEIEQSSGEAAGEETATFRVGARTRTLDCTVTAVEFDDHARMTAHVTAPEVHAFRTVDAAYTISQDRRGAFQIRRDAP